MEYITTDIITAEWIAKKQFYKALWMQDFTTWEIIQVRQFVWEFTKEELIWVKENIETQLIEVNEKINLF